MKKQLVIAGAMLLSIVGFAQKKEIKKAEKALTSGNATEAISLLNQAEGLIAAADGTIQAQYYVVKAEALLKNAGDDLSKLKMVADVIGKARGVKESSKFEARLADVAQNTKAALVNSAIKDQNTKNYTAASEKLHASYMMSKADTAYLYYAAGNAVNAKDYDKAKQYYKELVDLGFTGQKDEYVATNKETGEVEAFGNATERDLMVQSGSYIKPEIRKTESLSGDILKNLTLIYIEQGQEDEAMKVMKSARDQNPTDATLIRSEAEMVYRMGDLDRYNQLMSELVATDPQNPELYFNLGVASAELKNYEKAEQYYDKAISLDPSYASALINMSVLKLAKEKEIVDEMNNLGNSRADNARYDELKGIRKALYMEAMPYLEKAAGLRPDNIEILRTLMNIYTQVGDDVKFKAIKARVQTMEGGQ